MAEGRLQGKVAIVTGGAQGIGGATARRLAADGAAVVVVDIDAPLARANVERIAAAGGTASFLEGDVSREETAKAMVEAATARHGRLDILVQNAFPVGAAGYGGGALEVTVEAWRAGLDVLVGALFLGARHAVPAMAASGPPPGFDPAPWGRIGLHAGDPPPTEVGRIVNMASVHGLLQAAGVMIYEVGKAAVIGLTRQMAIDFGPKGITVNAVAPGHMVTEKLQRMWAEAGNEAGFRLFELQYPVRRTGTPEDVAHAVAFLCSSEASFITGVTLPVDGGLSIQLQENIVMEVKDYILQHPGIRTAFDRWGADAQRH